MTLSQMPFVTGRQHQVLEGVCWRDYERVLEELRDRPVQVTYYKGRMEIMPPLPEHEWAKKAIAQLIEAMTVALKIRRRAYGSTTFRREGQEAGLEPDECYYFQNAAAVRGMKRFDPLVHPAPDLAVEIDITRRSVPRQPIYAELGVRELWRFDGKQLAVFILDASRSYVGSSFSPTFPFLPLSEFESYIHRMDTGEQSEVLEEFRDWVSKLER